MSLQIDVRSILEEGVARGDVAGATVEIVSPEGVLCSAAAGVRALEDESAAPMTIDTVCWIASMNRGSRRSFVRMSSAATCSSTRRQRR